MMTDHAVYATESDVLSYNQSIENSVGRGARHGCPFFISIRKWKMDDHFPFALENENNGMYTDPAGGANAFPQTL